MAPRRTAGRLRFGDSSAAVVNPRPGFNRRTIDSPTFDRVAEGVRGDFPSAAGSEEQSLADVDGRVSGVSRSRPGLTLSPEGSPRDVLDSPDRSRKADDVRGVADELDGCWQVQTVQDDG